MKTNACADFLTDLLLSVGGRPTAVRDLAPKDRAAYMRDAKARSRAKAREARAAAAAGQAPARSPLPTADEVRNVLADAALVLLAAHGPGAEQLRKALLAAWPDKSALPVAIASKVRRGQMRPRSPRVKARLAEAAG